MKPILGGSEMSSNRPSLEEWRAVIQEQRESGLSIAAWCRQQSIPYCRFSYWRDKIDAERISGRFVRLKDQPEKKPITICLGEYRVEIQEQFDDQTLTRCLCAIRRAV
jgi:hypothetical protein